MRQDLKVEHYAHRHSACDIRVGPRLYFDQRGGRARIVVAHYDRAAQIMLARCRQFLASRSDKSWDATTAMKVK